MKRFLIYLLRWELSTPILALCLHFLGFNIIINTIIANLIGGCLFYFIDKRIFKEEKLLPKEITDNQVEINKIMVKRGKACDIDDFGLRWDYQHQQGLENSVKHLEKECGDKDYLKDKFEQAHISKTELAKRTGIDRATLSYYINGRKKINKVDHITAIAQALDIDIKEFIEEIMK